MKKSVNLFTQGQYTPGAFITKSRQRIKQYNDTVYLNDGDEFEIELFNPTTSKILAKISLNGKSLGSGIVLRPGERVFLERYLDDARKFLFETYEVNKNDRNAMRAIMENGKVTVEFYNESCLSWAVTLTGGSPTWTQYSGQYYTGGHVKPTYTNDVNCFFMQSNDSVNFSNSISEASVSYSAPVAGGHSQISASLNNIETGRVEKGSNSNQSFVYDSTSFDSWYTWKSEWKILPFSQKPFESKDLKIYCTNCGTKQKKQSHKFCPNCGNKY